MDYEVSFWSQIVGDHMRFIIGALDISEGALLNRAISLRDEADQVYEGKGDALSLAYRVRDLKVDILKRQTEGSTKILLPPTFLNHTLNEVNEMINILKGIVPSEGMIHKLWLQDAMGHAGHLHDTLDPTEGSLRKELKMFKKKFKIHLITNEEYMQYSEHMGKYFPREELHTARVRTLMNEFIEILNVLVEGKASNSVLSAFSILVPDHMYREECYYLRKLGYDAPDPTVRRIE